MPNPFELLAEQSGDTSSGSSRSGRNTPQSKANSPAPKNNGQRPAGHFHDKKHQFSERKREAKNYEGNTPPNGSGRPSQNGTPTSFNHSQNARPNPTALPVQDSRPNAGAQADFMPPRGPRGSQTERRPRGPANAPRSITGTESKPRKWAKNVSLTETLRRRDNLKHEKEVRMWELRQKPPPSQTFIAAGTFHWPQQEFDPEEVFGKDLQALDIIRKTTGCHIVYEKEKNAVQVMPTRNEQDLRDALQQLRITVYQLIARRTPPIKTHLLYWHDPATPCPSRVIHVERPTINTVTSKGHGAQKTPSGDGFHSEPSTHILSQQHSSRVKRAMLRKLEDLVHYEGNLQLRIRLGTFIALRFKDAASYALEEYQNMLGMSQFEGHVSQEASQTDTEEQMLGTVRNTTNLFVPHDNDVSYLGDIRPIYTATFTFCSLPGINVDVRLIMTWSPDYHSKTYRLSSKRWFSLDPQTRHLLELNLIDISRHSAWSFNLTSLRPVDEARLPDNLRAFPDTVKLNPSAFDERATSMPIVHAPSPFMKHMERRAMYQFRFDRGEFVLELSRFQLTEFGPTSGSQRACEHRWAANLFCPEWDAMFSENDGLPMGKKVSWVADVGKWFPADMEADWTANGDGWAQLLEKLQKTEALLLRG